MSRNAYCRYCKKPESATEPCLSCSSCKRSVHITCLRSPSSLPGILLGDVFFRLTCEDCNEKHKEILTRDKMSWLSLVTLVLYNLHQQSQTSSRRGYFHWKIHICKFIQDKWKILFAASVKRKKTWMGTVSGTLTHAPTIFQSGLEELGEAGWWRLHYPHLLPRQTMALKSQLGSFKSAGKQSSLQSEMLIKSEDNSSLCSDSMPEQTRPDSSSDSEMCMEPLSDVTIDTEVEVDMDEDTTPGLYQPTQLPDSLISDAVELVHAQPYMQSWTVKQETAGPSVDQEAWTVGEQNNHWARKIIKQEESSLDTVIKQENQDYTEEVANLPEGPRPCQPMSQYEEVQLMHSLQRAGPLPDAAARRLLRKLAVRHAKRKHNMALFNTDLCPTGYTFKDPSLSKHHNYGYERVLDRFQSTSSKWEINGREDGQEQTSFLFKLTGQNDPSCFYSPYTERLLKPYIMREPNCRAPWLQVMGQIQSRVNKHPVLATLDYSYIRPHHVAPINALCKEFFWPGIDVSEVLQYPDFSCVALYKKLVVGFALLVPNVGYNESYITFLFVRPEWRRAGIASFMLYHLIQTCMGRDVTLHVSATNPALILYQKFGFKVEELVQDFYEKYFDVDSKECRHALFLRLSR